MKVLYLSQGIDTGGQGARLKKAFDRHTDWEFRSACARQTYIGYPTDMSYQRAQREMASFDVIHTRDSFVEPCHVIHYHGSRFRNNPRPYLREQKRRGLVGLVSTLDLYVIAPDRLEWSPSPYDLEWLATFRQPLDDEVLRIAHCPTNRQAKSTEAFLAAVARVKKKRPVKLLMAEGVDWMTCLRLKGTADVYFDQTAYSYGNNSIEAWGMGIPVIAGAQPDTLAEMKNRFGDLPFFEATEDTIYAALMAMTKPDVRGEYAARGLEHVRRFHDDAKVVARLQEIYSQV